MDDHRNAICALVEKLETNGAEIFGLNIAEPMDPALPEILASLGASQPPEPLLSFYRQVDGASMMWNINTEPEILSGGFNLQSIAVTVARNGANAESEPLEGILWTGDEDPQSLELLKQMVIFDSVPGRNDFLTYLVNDPEQVFLVADGMTYKIYPSIDECIELLIGYGGSDSLRMHMCHPDWAQRIEVDARLKRFAAP